MSMQNITEHQRELLAVAGLAAVSAWAMWLLLVSGRRSEKSADPTPELPEPEPPPRVLPPVLGRSPTGEIFWWLKADAKKWKVVPPGLPLPGESCVLGFPDPVSNAADAQLTEEPSGTSTAAAAPPTPDVPNKPEDLPLGAAAWLPFTWWMPRPVPPTAAAQTAQDKMVDDLERSRPRPDYKALLEEQIRISMSQPQPDLTLEELIKLRQAVLAAYRALGFKLRLELLAMLMNEDAGFAVAWSKSKMINSAEEQAVQFPFSSRCSHAGLGDPELWDKNHKPTRKPE